MYIKVIESGYITGIGTGIVGEEISESEYNKIMVVIQNKPTAEEGYQYMLRADTMEWELVAIPQPSEDDEISNDEALSIITGESS